MFRKTAVEFLLSRMTLEDESSVYTTMHLNSPIVTRGWTHQSPLPPTLLPVVPLSLFEEDAAAEAKLVGVCVGIVF